MKNLITMMNAMKFYNYNELVKEGEDFQEKLDMARPTYQKMMDRILGKFFLNRA